MTVVVEVKGPNFVAESAFTLTSKSGTQIRFDESDGVRIVAKDDVPYVEMKIGDDQVSWKLNTESLEELLKMLVHTEQVDTKKMSILEAALDESIPTNQLVESFAESQANGGPDAGRMVGFDIIVRDMKREEKIQKIVESASEMTGKILSDEIVKVEKINEA